MFAQLDVEQLWIAFGKGKDFRWIPIHDIAKTLGPKARALPFFHAFTGCDTVSAFVGKGKSCWQAWNVFLDATEVFHRFSAPIDKIGSDCVSIIEAFVVIMYDRSSSTNDVNEARLDLFARKQKPYNAIPPSKAALTEHVKRAVLQAGHTWGQSLNWRMEFLPPDRQCVGAILDLVASHSDIMPRTFEVQLQETMLR